MRIHNYKLMPLHAQGFTLIEIMIALLVLSIGLLGLAGLQALSLRSNHSAYLRAQATFLAYDILDRMRVNPVEAANGNYLTNFNAAPANNNNCEMNACTSSNMAAFDIAQWKCLLGNWNAENPCTGFGITGYLPKGDGQITLNGNITTVAIRYEERDGNLATLQISSRI